MRTAAKATGVIDFDWRLGLCPLEHICQHVRLAQSESLEYVSLTSKRSATDLAIALSEFQRNLSPDQLTQFSSLQSYTPTADDVLSLTNDIVAKNSDRKSRLFASRVQPLLVSIQQYCTVLDTYAGSHPIVALVWGSIKLVLLVCPGRHYLFSIAYDCLLARLHRTMPNTSTSSPSVLLS
jgi:hypothetical protein